MTWPNTLMPDLDEAPAATAAPPPHAGNALDLDALALFHVTYRGQTFTLDLIEANERLDAILAECKKAGEQAQAEDRPSEKWLWLRMLQDYVNECGGPQMRPQALHALWHEVQARFFALDRRQSEELAALLGSPPSTAESTPPAFPPGT